MQSEEVGFQSAFERGQRLGCSDVHRKVNNTAQRRLIPARPFYCRKTWSTCCGRRTDLLLLGELIDLLHIALVGHHDQRLKQNKQKIISGIQAFGLIQTKHGT